MKGMLARMELLQSIRYDNCRSWVTCAAYALLNALPESSLEVLNVENSTGVTFGISSYGAQFGCTRILAPLTAFWDGKDSLKKIMGISLEEYAFQDKGEVMDFLSDMRESRVLLGPINMANLTYLPLSVQYQFSDHYITINKIRPDEYILTDSEGIPAMKISKDELSRALSISGIPEAGGLFHLGIAAVCQEALPPLERTRAIFRNAEKNYLLAETEGQGGRAFLSCRDIMDSYPPSRWIEPLRYALDFLMQRKVMFLAADPEGEVVSPACMKHITKQIDTLQTLRSFLTLRRFSDVRNLLAVAAEAETALFVKWKEWIWT